jgi:hypothetical protein
LFHFGGKSNLYFQKNTTFAKKIVKRRINPLPRPPVPFRMIRKNKQVLLFNDKEMEAVNQFCKKYKIQSKSRFFREVIISTILQKMEEDHPKLF